MIVVLASSFVGFWAAVLGLVAFDLGWVAALLGWALSGPAGLLAAALARLAFRPVPPPPPLPDLPLDSVPPPRHPLGRDVPSFDR